ncbi:LytTR family DNA-binding domain-containing protein [Hymenobacter sp. GOD-10R]|uniref:LytR/AlgR family response regulator transcription factor n=1 Tax=Hymenobacter sp. GOD-10R TaxID=3093922 RepID=UPI002D769327|nr:LytTR family DNA-binding domain-containing protein [Hymenobacter sp. GOD-10R]WRQ26577.1 LytTR family DNA-binding domain-containing protein [Hymenobacter sp. GOD-10R]
MDPIRALLVDDEPLARRLLRELLTDFPRVEVTGECTNGREALEALQANTYDLAFLDVQMPDLDGVQVLRQLIEAGQRLPLIVFTTAYDQYAVQAFALHAVDYLLKPIDPDRFADCLASVQQRLAQQQSHAVSTHLASLLGAWPVATAAPVASDSASEVPEYQDRFLIRTTERNFFVPAAEVLYLEATGSVVTLHTLAEPYTLRTPLTQLESRLDPATFLRIHRSCIINVDHIREFKHWAHGEYVFRMNNGAYVTSSRSYSAVIQQFLKRFA